MKDVLLHCCCAPCSSAILEWMLANDVRPTLFYCNPNIFPEEEYLIRKNEITRYAEKLGITVFDIPVENPSQLSDAAKELNTKAEAVVILPDNMVSKNSWNITSQTIAGEIPLYGVNISQVREGALAGYCYDFVSLGESAGQQAVSILHGESAADMPVVMAHDCNLYVNSDRLKDLDMKIPDEYKAKATEVKTSYDK